MYPTSAKFQAAIAGTHRKVVRARILTDIQFGAKPTGGQPLAIKSGQVKFNSKEKVKAQLSLTVVGDYWEALEPYGVEIFVERGIAYGDGTEELVPLGYFRVDRISQGSAPAGEIQVEASERMTQLQDARIVYPYDYPAGVTHATLFDRLVNGYNDGLQRSYGLYPRVGGGADVPVRFIGYDGTRAILPAGVVDDDAYEYMAKLAETKGCVLRFNRLGELEVVARDVPPGTDPDYVIKGGVGGNLVSASRELTREGVRNMIVTRGSDPAYPTGYALAYNFDPSNKLYIFGPFGVVPQYYASPLLQSNEQASAAAARILAKYKGLPSGLATVTVPNPAVDALDCLRITVGTKIEDHVADEVTIPLAGDGMGVVIATRALNAVPVGDDETDPGTGTGGDPGSGTGGGGTATPFYAAAFPDGRAFPTFTEPASNQAIPVANTSELTSKLAAAAPGQTLVLADGTYSPGILTTTKVGTKSQPIVIKSLNPGGAKLATGSGFSLRGQYILVKNINKEVDDAGKSFAIEGAAQFCGYEGCLVGPATLPAPNTGVKGLHYYIGGTAQDCFITYCESRNKSRTGNGVLVDGDFNAGQTGGCKHILLDHLDIHDFGTEAINDFEAIRFGVSTMQETVSNSTIMRCMFRRIKTEPEIISIKSGKVQSWGHTVQECVGSLSIRHGDNNFHRDCYMFGSTTGAGGTKSGGSRVYGKNNDISYMYWQDLNGSSYESTLTIDGGDTATSTNGHQNVVGGNFSNNLAVNCATGVVIGEHYSTAPSGITVKDNDFVNSGGTAVRQVKAATGASVISNNTHYATPAAAGLTGPTGGAYRKAGRGPRLVMLTAADVGPAGLRTDGTGPGLDGSSGSVTPDLSAQVVGAQAMADRIDAGGSFDTATFTWPGAPTTVTTVAATLRAKWVSDGSPSGVRVWLGSFITANGGGGTGGGTGTVDSIAKLLNLGFGDGLTKVNIGVGFAAGDVPTDAPGGGTSAAKHVDYDLTRIVNKLNIPGYFELVTTAGEQRVRASVTGKGGKTSTNTAYDRVEFRGLAPNGVDKEIFNPSAAGSIHYLYWCSYVMRMANTKSELVVGQCHDAADDTVMIRFSSKTTVQAKLGDEVLGSLTTNYVLGQRSQGMIKITGTGSNNNVEWMWSQGNNPLPSSGPGYFKRNNAGLGPGQYFKSLDYGQARLSGFGGAEDPATSPLFVVEMTKLIIWHTGMAAPITTIG